MAELSVGDRVRYLDNTGDASGRRGAIVKWHYDALPQANRLAWQADTGHDWHSPRDTLEPLTEVFKVVRRLDDGTITSAFASAADGSDARAIVYRVGEEAPLCVAFANEETARSFASVMTKRETVFEVWRAEAVDRGPVPATLAWWRCPSACRSCEHLLLGERVAVYRDGAEVAEEPERTTPRRCASIACRATLRFWEAGPLCGKCAGAGAKAAEEPVAEAEEPKKEDKAMADKFKPGDRVHWRGRDGGTKIGTVEAWTFDFARGLCGCVDDTQWRDDDTGRTFHCSAEDLVEWPDVSALEAEVAGKAALLADYRKSVPELAAALSAAEADARHLRGESSDLRGKLKQAQQAEKELHVLLTGTRAERDLWLEKVAELEATECRLRALNDSKEKLVEATVRYNEGLVERLGKCSAQRASARERVDLLKNERMADAPVVEAAVAIVRPWSTLGALSENARALRLAVEDHPSFKAAEPAPEPEPARCGECGQTIND